MNTVICFFVDQHGLNAVSMAMAEQYIAAFGNLAKETNTVLLPTNTGDISSMVTQVNSSQLTQLISFAELVFSIKIR